MAGMSPDNEAHKTESSSPFTKALKILAYPISLGAGLWTARINTSDATYQRMKIDGGIDDLRNTLMAKRKEMTQKAVASLEHEGAETATREFIAASKVADKAYFKAIEDRYAKLGLSTFAEQWDFIHRSQRQDAIINGLTITGITIGALLTIANSKAVSNLFEPGEESPREK